MNVNMDRKKETFNCIKKWFVYMAIQMMFLLVLRFGYLGVGLFDICLLAFFETVTFAFFAVVYFYSNSKMAGLMLIFLFNACSIYILGERMVSEVILSLGKQPYWINIILLFALMVFIYGVTNSGVASVIIVNSVYFVLVIVNTMLKQFRGRGIDAIDFYSIKAAASVKSSYKFVITTAIIVGTILIVWLTVFICFLIKKLILQMDKTIKRKYWIIRGVCFFAGMLPFVLILTTPLMESMKITPAYSSERNGILFNLLYESKYLGHKKPSDYSLQYVDNIILQYDKSDDITNFDMEMAPNVIVVMNESLADLRVLGDFETNMEVTPFLDGLRDNTIKGYAFSSIYAGNTAVSEYEFLMGDSNCLHNTMPFATLIKEGKTPISFVTNMKSLGYTCIAMHSYNSSAYRRVPVYTTFGFDEMYFENDMEELEYLRGFASDSSQYKTIYKRFEEKDAGEKLFLFNVTMQNHGDYNKGIADFSNKITLTDIEKKYPQAEEYLSCLYESDKAIKELFEYFTDKEPTIILIFGDHQPKVENDFIKEIMGTSINQYEELKYMVPYYVWANYDLQLEQEVGGQDSSLNYLGAILKSYARLPLTAYEKYLLLLSKIYPVISSYNIQAADNANERMLAEYNCLMYNHMSDWKNTRKAFFGY